MSRSPEQAVRSKDAMVSAAPVRASCLIMPVRPGRGMEGCPRAASGTARPPPLAEAAGAGRVTRCGGPGGPWGAARGGGGGAAGWAGEGDLADQLLEAGQGGRAREGRRGRVGEGAGAWATQSTTATVEKSRTTNHECSARRWCSAARRMDSVPASQGP
ncbi:hypothetical protein SHKM778_78870 [Streptomyces sp. KM77-8]|uniref:Uncharacterized protein n=1 Tax=Streptomyces haneummycinicus TaxID=3074435 RepID=A0AAT9HVM5_9ACTN